MPNVIHTNITTTMYIHIHTCIYRNIPM